MSAAMKFFFVIVAIACCMQFVEMHRIRRDDQAISATPDIAKSLESLLASIKENIDNSVVVKDLRQQIDNIKPEDATDLLQKVTTSLKESLGNVETFVKNALEKANNEPAKTD